MLKNKKLIVSEGIKFSDDQLKRVKHLKYSVGMLFIPVNSLYIRG